MWLFRSLAHVIGRPSASGFTLLCSLSICGCQTVETNKRKPTWTYIRLKKYSEDAQIQRETQEREAWKDLAALCEPQTENL